MECETSLRVVIVGRMSSISVEDTDRVVFVGLGSCWIVVDGMIESSMTTEDFFCS